jgi:hypothetical protein
MRTKRIAKYGAVLTVVLAMAVWMLPAWGQSGSASKARTDGPNTKLINELAAARIATAKYATSLGRAKRDGYGIITQMIPNMGFHFMNPSISGFDITKPQILVYEHTGQDTWQLGALEWVFTEMPRDPPLPNATFGFFPAACHYKDGTFIPDEDQTTCLPRNPDTGAKFNFWHPDLFTMHVWLWYPNPAGLYSGTNPLVAPFNGG